MANPVGMTVTAVPTHAPGLGAPPPALGAPPPVVAHLVHAARSALYIPTPAGRFIRIDFQTEDQADRHRDLHMALVAGQPPGTVINLKAGTLVRDGKTVEFLHEDPAKERLLHEMRCLYHEVLGQTYSDNNWDYYVSGDRAPYNIPPAFQQLNQGSLLKKIEFTWADEQNAQAGKTQAETQKSTARYRIGNRLLADVPAALDRGITHLSALHTLESQSRVTQLRRTKEHFEQSQTPCRHAMIEFAAFHPLTLTGPTGSKQAQLSAQKQGALNYLQTATGRVAGTVFNRQEDAQLMDQLATEMALMSCTTPEDYEMGCLLFGVEKTQTSPELFLIGLAEKIRANNTQPANPQTPGNIRVGAPASDMSEIEDYIDQGMKLCFPHLNHPEDRATMAQALLQIANHMIDGGPNGSQRNHLRNPWYPGIGLP